MPDAERAKLAKALEETQAVLAKHDFAGIIVLCDKQGNATYSLEVFDSDWAALEQGENGAIKMRYMRDRPDQNASTIALLANLHRILAGLFYPIDTLAQRIAKMGVEIRGKAEVVDEPVAGASKR